MSVRLYVGNLPKEQIEREQLQDLFADAGDQVFTKVIKDRKTKKCRGFAFVTVPDDQAADQFIEKYNGQSFMDNQIKIEKALPRSNKDKDQEEGTETAAKNDNNRRKKNNKRSSRRPSTGATSKGSSTSDQVQPDPRWADQLAKLKEMLAANNN